MVAFLALVTTANPSPVVIGTLVVLQNLLTNLWAIDLPACLGVASGNDVLAAKELLLGVDHTSTSLPGLATKVAKLSTTGAG